MLLPARPFLQTHALHLLLLHPSLIPSVFPLWKAIRSERLDVQYQLCITIMNLFHVR